MVQEKKKGAPLSAEEWQAFDIELADLASRIEERLAKIVQELVHLIIPAACGRIAEASALAQGLIHPTKPWAPANEIRFYSSMHTSTPDPELLQGSNFGEVVLESDEAFESK